MEFVFLNNYFLIGELVNKINTIIWIWIKNNRLFLRDSNNEKQI